MFTEKNIVKQVEIWNNEILSNEEIDIIFDELKIEDVNKQIQFFKLKDMSIPYYFDLKAIYVTTVFNQKSIIYDTENKKFFFIHIEDYIIENNLIDMLA